MVEELCEVVEIRRVNDIVMAEVNVLEERVLSLINWYATQSGRRLAEKTVSL